MKLLSSGANRIRPVSLAVTLLLFATLAVFTGCEQKEPGKVGGKAPGISGVDIHGEYVSLSQFKGKVVVLIFWTKSCCGEKIKELEPYYKLNRDKGLAILGINENNSKEIVESYSKANGLTFSMQTDEMGMAAREYGVFGFPTVFIIDREGVIRKKILGDINIEQLNKVTVQFLTK